LIKRLKKVAKKAKLGEPSTFEEGPQYQNHAKTNVRILGDVMVVQRWNDQKVVSCTYAKAQCKWDKLVIITKPCPPLPKSTLVKLISKELLQVLGLNGWGVGSVP
jgi:hypothetical protein